MSGAWGQLLFKTVWVQAWPKLQEQTNPCSDFLTTQISEIYTQIAGGFL
jgi:hypothetical protein